MNPDSTQTPKTAANTCFARRHLPPAVTAFYSYALAVSRDSGIFYSDCRRDAEEFGVSKNTILRYMKIAENEGWMKRITTGKRLKRNKLTGSYDSIPFRVLDHDEYAVNHPGKCRYPNAASDRVSQKLGQDTGPSVSILGTACPNSWSHLSPKVDSPVPKSGTKTVKRDGKEEKKGEGEAPTISALQNPALTSGRQSCCQP